MSRHAYYERMKSLARETREEYHLSSPRVRRSDLRRIYKDQDIRIDIWPGKLRQLRGAYFDDPLGPSVMIAKNLPDDPYIFTLGHELKHHLEDRAKGLSYCTENNTSEPIEIGAEVFAAELIFPEQDFADRLHEMGIGPGQCTPRALVQLKHTTSTTLSYAGLAKRAMRMGFSPSGSLDKIQWRKLEESVYGEPIYKTILRYRRSRAKAHL